MRPKQQHSIDGFAPRRASAQVGKKPTASPSQRQRLAYDSSARLNNARALKTSVAGARSLSSSGGSIALGRADIDESLKAIEDSPAPKKSTRRARRRAKRANRSRRQVIRKRIITALVVLFVLLAGFVALRLWIAGGNIFRGNIFDAFQSSPLKMDANGRSNIIVFGTAEDSEGGEHDGAELTDSMMLVSIDQNRHNAYMVSLPRDLWIEHQTPCMYQGGTTHGKINEVFACNANSSGEVDEAAGAKGVMSHVGEVLGLDVQYYAHVNFTVVKEAVDAVGGVEIEIDSDDPRGILDRNFDWKCNYQCYYVKYENGPTGIMDGEHALALARARNAQGGYGLSSGNFDREKHQQQIIKALREKAVSAGTLSNVGKVTSLIDALGNNLRTNFELREVRTLVRLGTEIKSSSINSVSLVDEDEPMVEVGNLNGISIVRPVDGLYQYSSIQRYLERHFTPRDTKTSSEQASIAVLNGSGVPGAAQAEAERLEALGFEVSTVGNAPEGSYGHLEIYQLRDGLLSTRDKLASTYNATIKKNTPFQLSDAVDFVVVIGSST